MPDWAWLLPMNVILIVSIVWDAIRRERAYREIRRITARIGQDDPAATSAAPDEPAP